MDATSTPPRAVFGGPRRRLDDDDENPPSNPQPPSIGGRTTVATSRIFRPTTTMARRRRCLAIATWCGATCLNPLLPGGAPIGRVRCFAVVPPATSPSRAGAGLPPRTGELNKKTFFLPRAVIGGVVGRRCGINRPSLAVSSPASEERRQHEAGGDENVTVTTADNEDDDEGTEDCTRGDHLCCESSELLLGDTVLRGGASISCADGSVVAAAAADPSVVPMQPPVRRVAINGTADDDDEEVNGREEETSPRQQHQPPIRGDGVPPSPAFSPQFGSDSSRGMEAGVGMEDVPTVATDDASMTTSPPTKTDGETGTKVSRTRRLLAKPSLNFFTPLDRKILQVALPCIANFAINPLIGAVDLFWVGQMGEALAVAGQGAANQVFNSAFWLASFMPSVTATLVSTAYAEGDTSKVQDTVCQSLFLSFFIAVASTAALIPCANGVLRSVLPGDAPAMRYALPYFRIRALSFLPSLVSVIGYSAFRGALDTVTPLRISLFANVFNAVLDPICIFRLGMGVSGAALATVASEVISSVVYVAMLLRSNMIRWSKLVKLPKWANLKPLLKGGAALQLRNFAINVTFLAVARATQAIDDTGVAAAAHSIAIQVFQVGGIVLLALSTVAQTLVPAEMVRRVDPATGLTTGGMTDARLTVRRLMRWGLVLGGALGALQIALLPFIHKISPLVEVQKAALVPSYLASVLQIINGMVFIGEGVMVGCGNFLQLSISTVIATAATTWALRILPPKFGLTGVWMSFAVFNGLRLAGVWIHQTRTGPLTDAKLRDTAAA